MRELGSRSALSQPFLSNIENGRGMPSVATLYRLARALGVEVHDLLPASGADDDVVLVRAADGLHLRVADQADSATSRLLAAGPHSPTQARYFRISEGQPIGDWFEHDGEDLVIVITGSLQIEFLDGRTFSLDQGDSLWHRSEIAHRWTLGEHPEAEVVLVTSTTVEHTTHHPER